MSGDRRSAGAEGVISRAGMVVVRCRTYADSAVPHQDQVAFIISVRRLRSDVLDVVLVVCSNLTIDLGYTVPSSVRQCPIAQLERPTRSLMPWSFTGSRARRGFCAWPDLLGTVALSQLHATQFRLCVDPTDSRGYPYARRIATSPLG